jgi:hypothetical protein
VRASCSDAGILACLQYTDGNIIPHNAQELFCNAGMPVVEKVFEE